MSLKLLPITVKQILKYELHELLSPTNSYVDTGAKRRINLVFWPSFPLGLCVRRSRSPPVWPVCICISAALPDTPSDLHLDRGKSCRRSLVPASGREHRCNMTFKKQHINKGVEQDKYIFGWSDVDNNYYFTRTCIVRLLCFNTLM